MELVVCWMAHVVPLPVVVVPSTSGHVQEACHMQSG